MDRDIFTQRLFDGIRSGNIDLAREAIESGADIHYRDGHGYTALLSACSFVAIDAIDPLIQAGADVNASDNYGNTALLLAANKDNAEICEKLIRAGADVNLTCKSGGTAVMYASFYAGGQALEKILAASPDLERRCDSGSTAAMYAISSGNCKPLLMLRQAGAIIPSMEFGIDILRDFESDESHANACMLLAKEHGLAPASLLGEIREIGTKSARAAISLIESDALSDLFADIRHARSAAAVNHI